MEDNLKFLCNYNLECEATVYETGEVLFRFNAREYTQNERGAGYVPGGIASGNQKYAIKTRDDRVRGLKPYVNNIVVEGICYALTFLKIRKADLPFMGERQKGKRNEYILELE